MFDPKYALFYDNHTQEQVYDYGMNFDPEAFAAQVKRCGVDFLTIHARCNRGFAYYPTKKGTPHPALKSDIVGGVAAACEKLGIKLAVYFNGSLSGIEAVQHPEWTVVYPDGGNIDVRNPSSPFSVRMCYNSPYRRHLMDMISETAEMYPYISGVFIDCTQSFPCRCPYCQAKLEQLGGMIPWEELGDISLKEFCADIGECIRRSFPGGEAFFNSCNIFRFGGKYNTFYDCECLPTAGWGYDCLPTLVHWVPALEPRKPVLNMTGRFYRWGDFGGLRTVNSLAYDLFYGLMYGMRPEIGGHFHPRGELDMPVFDTIAETYERLRRFESYYTDAPRKTDIAVLLSSEAELKSLRSPVRGAVRMLEELKLPFTVITDPERDLEDFKLLILPENTDFPETLKSNIASFGGAVIGCGSDAARELGEFFGVEYQQESPLPAYYDAPGMTLSLYSGADETAVLPGAQGDGALIRPYCSAGFENGMAVNYLPPERKSGYPLTVRKGRRLFCAGHIFSGYYAQSALHLRDLLAAYIGEFIPAPQFRGRNLYSFTRISIADEPGRKIVSILNFVPESRCAAVAVEDEIELGQAQIAVRLDGLRAAKVVCGAERRELDFAVEEDYCCIQVPPFKGFTALEISE